MRIALTLEFDLPDGREPLDPDAWLKAAVDDVVYAGADFSTLKASWKKVD